MSSTDYDRLIPYLQSFTYNAVSKTSFDIQQTNPSQKWIFKQIGIENENPKSTNTTVTLYLNKVILAPSSFLSPTPNGLGTAASGQPYIVLHATDVLTIAVAGAQNGDVINIQGLYTERLASE